MVEEICEALESIVSPAIVVLQHQWISFELDGIPFEISVGRRGDSWPENVYLMFSHDSKWGQAHPRLWNRYGGNAIRGVRKNGSKNTEALVAAEPFALDYSRLNEWEKTLATGLVVILKYWNFLYRQRIPSFVIELNVANWLESNKPKGSPRSIFELISTFLRSKANYDGQLFQRLPSFQVLRKVFRTAERLTASARQDDAVDYLSAVLPWPDRFQCFGPFLKKGLDELLSRIAELDRLK